MGYYKMRLFMMNVMVWVELSQGQKCQGAY